MPPPSTITPTLLAEIFSAPVPYKDADEEEQCSKMLDGLSASELESAARTSYAYHIASASSDESVRSLATEAVRRKMAAKMARRHLEQKRLHGSREKALESLRECLVFRKERGVDNLRFCFRPKGGDENGDADPVNAEKCASLSIREDELPDSATLSKMEAMIRKDESAQPIFVRGKDLKDRAIVVKYGRTSPECDEDAYILTHIYVAERAIAATEISSKGREEKLLSAIDFDGYGQSCRPPLHAIKRLTKELQENYPERLDHSVLVEPPLWMRTLFGLLKPFLDPDTKGKIVMVNGEKQRSEKLSPLVAKEEAMPFMLPGGMLSSEVDVERYLKDVPFFASYN